MNSNLKFSLSIGAFLTLIVYVAGFTWQYTYLGVITNDIGWINVITSDYIHLGIMAIMFVMKPWAIGTLALLVGGILCGLLDKTVIKIWNDLSHKNKIRFHRFFRAFNSNVSTNVSAKRFSVYIFLILFSLRLVLEISNVSAEHMAQRLMSEGVDRVCNKKENCYEGKVLYIGDKQIYFYSFDGEKNITDGVLMIMNIADSTVFMEWNEHGREVINSHISNKS